MLPARKIRLVLMLSFVLDSTTKLVLVLHPNKEKSPLLNLSIVGKCITVINISPFKNKFVFNKHTE